MLHFFIWCFLFLNLTRLEKKSVFFQPSWPSWVKKKMFTHAQLASLATADVVAPCHISEWSDAVRRDELCLVLEDGRVVQIRDDQKEQTRLLSENAPELDAAWLRLFPRNVCFVSQSGQLLPLVKRAPQDDTAESFHLVLDRSGSMYHVDAAAYEGARELLEKLPENTRVTVTLFSSDVQLGRHQTREEALATLSLREASGCTCLRDAIYQAIHAELGAPVTRTTIVVVTDGHDTSSTRSLDEARAAIATFQQRENYRLLFLGSNQDAIFAAQAYGIPVARAITYGSDGTHLRQAMRVASENTAAFRNLRFDGFSPMQRSSVL